MLEKARRLERLSTIDSLRPVDRPVVLAEIGRGRPIVAVTAAMHGDEETGVYILDALRQTLQPEIGTVRLVVANPPALFKGVRFIREDLNRVFPGDRNSSGENALAPKVLEIVRDSDYVIDLHTTSSDTESFVILGKRNEERLQLGEATGLQKIVLIEGPKDCAMVDFVPCGIGLELGLHASQYAYESGIQAVTNALSVLGIVPLPTTQEEERQYYEVFGSLKDSSSLELQNFRMVQEAGEAFYPLFVGERAYQDTICLKARKILRQALVGENI